MAYLTYERTNRAAGGGTQHQKTSSGSRGPNASPDGASLQNNNSFAWQACRAHAQTRPPWPKNFCARTTSAAIASRKFAGHRNQFDARSNWIEQLTNAAGQLCLLLALLLAH